MLQIGSVLEANVVRTCPQDQPYAASG